jgi:hypothetical protein
MVSHLYEQIRQINDKVLELSAMAKQNISDNSDLSQYSVQPETLVVNTPISNWMRGKRRRIISNYFDSHADAWNREAKTKFCLIC